MKTWWPDEALKAIPGLKPAQEKINGSIKAMVLATVVFAGVASFAPFGMAQSLGGFTDTGKMIQARVAPTVTLLMNGNVLVAGGNESGFEFPFSCTGYTTLASAELYDSSTGSFTLTGSMASARVGHTATLLANGKVLVAGGDENRSEFSDCGNFTTLASAELYDPATGTFKATGTMTEPRAGHTATLLGNGKVFIAGSGTAELYDPFTETFTPTRNLPQGPPFPKPLRDFDGNGATDVLWRNTAGTVSMWLMDGTGIASNSVIATISPGWSVSGIGDFNRDGKADILWRDTSGDVSIWLMDGTTIVSYSVIASIWTGWSVSGVGDFNGDGKADILWRERSGDVAIWFMDGTTISSYSTIANIWPGWSISGVGDFNEDGRADILWRDESGDAAIWLMDGTTIVSYSGIGTMPAPWIVAGVADFDGDGSADILWRDTSGGGATKGVAMSLMNGTVVTSHRHIADIWGGWSIAGTGDFNGDGAADILWRDTTGETAIWLMDGPRKISYSDMGNVSDRRAQ